MTPSLQGVMQNSVLSDNQVDDNIKTTLTRHTHFLSIHKSSIAAHVNEKHMCPCRRLLLKQIITNNHDLNHTAPNRLAVNEQVRHEIIDCVTKTHGDEQH